MNSIWKLFASIRLSVVLLLTIAASSIIGTFIPQNESPEEYVAAFGYMLYNVFQTLDFFDMYHSWWFQALLMLLTVNIVVCSFDRLPGTLKIVSSKVKPNAERFRNVKNKEGFSTRLSIEVLKEGYQRIVSKEFGDSMVEQTSEGFFIFGEKGRWTRFGVYGVHLSVILLLIGALVGSIFGFDGYVTIPEGGSVTKVQLMNTNVSKDLGFELRCDDFDVSFYESGTPKEFRSRLTVIEQGSTVLQKDIIVNDPLRYRGVNVFQSSYGPMQPKGVELTFVDTGTNAEYSQFATVGQTIELPGGLGTFVLRGYETSAEYRGQNLGGAFTGVLTDKNGEPTMVILPTQFPNFDRMRGGSLVVSVAGYEQRYYTGLQVTKDPGVWCVYSGFILLIVGCFITFFTSHRQLFIEVGQSGKECKVMIAGTANRDRMGMAREVEKISNRLARMDQTSSGDAPDVFEKRRGDGK